MKSSEFFTLYPVFTFKQFQNICLPEAKPETVRTALYRAHQRGDVRLLKRSLYQSRPAGQKKFPPPPSILVASQLAEDAVLSHHSAFEALGFSHSEFFNRTTYFTHSARHSIKIEGVQYQPLLHPLPLRKKQVSDKEVLELSISSLKARCTSRERTLVDGMESLEWMGGWEEYCHCVDKVASFKWEKVLQYAQWIDSAALFSRLGFFLEENQKRLFVPESLLRKFKEKKSKNIISLYSDSNRPFKINKIWDVKFPETAIIHLEELT